MRSPTSGPNTSYTKLVLGDPTEARERGRADARLEVVPVTGYVGAGPGDSSLDSLALAPRASPTLQVA